MKTTGDEVIHEVIGMVIIEMIVIGKMIRIPGLEIIGTPATIEAETTLTREDLRTDLGSIREITHVREVLLDNQGPETGITRPEKETTQGQPEK